MKNFKYIAAFISTLLCSACSNVENIPDTEVQQEPESYTISLGVGDETGSRASGNTIYGINVYFDKEKDGEQDDIYAYGLFDDPSKMTITLYTGYKFKFECTAVKNGKDKLFYGPYSSNSYSGYAAPFGTGKSSSTMLENKFVMNPGTYLDEIKSGTAVLKTEDGSYTSSSIPSIERYYGEVADYSPVLNGSVNIPLKKTYFGSRLVVKGGDWEGNGTVTVSCKISSTTYWSVNTTEALSENGTIYSYTNVYDCWKNEPKLTATITLKYDSNRGDWWDLNNSKTITFKRNVMTTVTVTVSPDFSSASFGITEEEFGEDNYIDYEINGEGQLEIPVTPDEED